MLAKLGIGNAHPGGFGETVEQLRQFPLEIGQHVLEVGCGTGRTACHLAEYGCHVTGVDIRPEMIAKARIRADKQQVQVQFMEGDACRLPFEDNCFDVVLVESVTNFTDAKNAACEYYRVLKPGGKLYDREVVKKKQMPQQAYGALCDFYGVQALYSISEWRHIWSSSGFKHVHEAGVHPFPQTMWEDAVSHPDPIHLADSTSLLDPQIWEITAQYDELMNRYHSYLGYSLMMGSKE